jgi:hypothetical protein
MCATLSVVNRIRQRARLAATTCCTITVVCCFTKWNFHSNFDWIRKVEHYKLQLDISNSREAHRVSDRHNRIVLSRVSTAVISAQMYNRWKKSESNKTTIIQTNKWPLEYWDNRKQHAAFQLKTHATRRGQKVRKGASQPNGKRIDWSSITQLLISEQAVINGHNDANWECPLTASLYPLLLDPM